MGNQYKVKRSAKKMKQNTMKGDTSWRFPS